MKFTPEVIAAIETLRKNAENDFELHRISVLEKDLTAPPVVEIIDDKHQSFNGEIYAKDKDGHYRKNVYIHRMVWQYYKGNIPINGYEIHHVNRKAGDNNVSNLQLMTTEEHRKCHRDHSWKKICPTCGKTFESKHTNAKFCSRKCSAHRFKKSAIEKKCECCGKIFLTPTWQDKTRKYCSRHCYQIMLQNKQPT